MDINAATLKAVYTGLSTAYNMRFDGVQTNYGLVAMEVSSTTAMNEYPRMDDVPGIREWVGDREVHDLGAQTYTVKNKEFEGTIGIKRSQIEDDQLGIFTPVAGEMGQNAAEFPDQLVFPLMKKGDQVKCYDGQNFFDTDHPGYNEQGNRISVSNYQPGANPAWFLIDDSRVMKPMLYQKRRAFDLIAKDNPDDENVWKKGQFQWGVDGRSNAGFGLWQLAYMSRAELTPANYEAARVAMTGIRKRSGQPINISPRRLIVPPVLESTGRQILEAALINGGDSNIWVNTAQLSVIQNLA